MQVQPDAGTMAPLIVLAGVRKVHASSKQNQQEKAGGCLRLSEACGAGAGAGAE